MNLVVAVVMLKPPAPLLYADDAEVIPPGEEETVAEIVAVIQMLLRQKWERHGMRSRDVHAKSHGCVRAEFRVLDGLPPELAQGAFSQAATYPALLRFSNLSPVPQSDLIPDGRGLAIQISGVGGEVLSSNEPLTQDFLLANHPVFLARDAADYLRVQRLRLQWTRQGIFTAHRALTGPSWNPARWHWREAWAAAQVATQAPRHPAGYRYFSMAPFRYGNHVAKFRVRPVPSSAGNCLVSSFWQKDALHLALRESLRANSLRLDFQVQLQTSAVTMPIEDATQRWSERESPFRSVAEIVIPMQSVAAPEEYGDGLSFSVWHALSAHRPLGGINRTRRAAYEASLAWRRAGFPPARE